MLSAQLLASDELHCANRIAFYLHGQLKEPAVTGSDIVAPLQVPLLGHLNPVPAACCLVAVLNTTAH